MVSMTKNSDVPIYILKRESRRSIGIRITPDGELVVRAPHLVPRYFIDRFIQEKHDWITKAKQKMALRPKATSVRYEEGANFSIAGTHYTLHITDGNTIVPVGTKLFFPKRFLRNPKTHMELWCRAFAKKYLTQRVHFFAEKMHATYKKISIRDTSSRWGSCSSSGTISFSYRLILADPSIIDYVVIHELAHTFHHNHGKEFWNLVSIHYPDYKAARVYLNQKGDSLHI